MTQNSKSGHVPPHAGKEGSPQGRGGGAHPVAVHASQQLGTSLAHAVPPRDGLQAVASDLTLHLVVPLALVRQHVTKPGLPHVERDAHFMMNGAQLLFVSDAFACSLAHRT